MKKMTKAQAELARDLAVAYQAFWQAHDIPDEKKVAADWNSLAVWSYTLKDKQALVGVKLMDPTRLDQITARARQQRDACEAHDRAALAPNVIAIR